MPLGVSTFTCRECHGCIWGIIICGRGCNYPNQGWDLCLSGASCVTLLHLFLFFAQPRLAYIHTHIHSGASDPLPNSTMRAEGKSAQESSSSPTHSLSLLRVYLSTRAQGMKGPDKICVVFLLLFFARTHTHRRSLSLLLNYCQQRFIPCYCQRFQIKATAPPPPLAKQNKRREEKRSGSE